MDRKDDVFDELLQELHRDDTPDLEKLKKKDQELVDLTAAPDRYVQNQLRLRNVTATEAEAFDKWSTSSR